MSTFKYQWLIQNYQLLIYKISNVCSVRYFVRGQSGHIVELKCLIWMHHVLINDFFNLDLETFLLLIERMWLVTEFHIDGN